MPRPFGRSRPLFAGILAAGLAAGVLGSGGARAAFIGCRSDPIVVLSNGVVLDLSANIADDVADIQSITYVLHVPTGVSLLKAVSTDGAVGYREQFNFQQDGHLNGSAGVYTVEVQVQTRAKNISITATITAGDAAVLGITPSMVGATSFSPVDANDAAAGSGKGPGGPGPSPKGPGGPGGPTPPTGPGGTSLTSLPPTMTSYIISWAQVAPWAVTASTTSATSNDLEATVTL